MARMVSTNEYKVIDFDMFASSIIDFAYKIDPTGS